MVNFWVGLGVDFGLSGGRFGPVRGSILVDLGVDFGKLLSRPGGSTWPCLCVGGVWWGWGWGGGGELEGGLTSTIMEGSQPPKVCFFYCLFSCFFNAF